MRSKWTVIAGSFLLALLIVQLSDTGAQTGNGRSRQEIYQEMESALGVVPTFMQSIPDNSLELEWELMKQVQMAPGPIPNKYRELIGVAVSAATKCRYCAYFHTQFAKLNGATDAEIEDALHYTKSTTGWSTYINGEQADYAQFCKEVDQICAHVKAAGAAKN